MRKVNSLLRKNRNQLDRSINSLNPLVKKTESLIKQSIKKNDMKSAKMYAKELIRIRKQRTRLINSKAQLSSITMQINESFSMLKIQGKISNTTGIMREVNSLIKLPELSATMNHLQRELTKSGIITEMMDDMVGVDEDDLELEDEAEEEIAKVIQDVANVQWNGVDAVPIASLESAEPHENEAQTTEENEEHEEILNQMRERLKELQL